MKTMLWAPCVAAVMVALTGCTQQPAGVDPIAETNGRIGVYDSRLFCTNGTVFCQPPNMRYKKVGEDEIAVPAEELQAEPGVRREVREFVECILSNAEPTIPGEEGVRNVEIAEAALISAAEKRPVDLPL